MNEKDENPGISVGNIPPEIAAKLSPKNKKTLNMGGSFVGKPQSDEDGEGEANGGGGIGSKAPENRKIKKPDGQPYGETENDDEQKKPGDIDEATSKLKAENDLTELAKKVLSPAKLRRFLVLLDQPDDVAAQLGIEFSDSDIEKLLFSGLSKEIDILKTGKVMATLRTLTKGDRDTVETLVKKAIKEEEDEVATKGGIDNFRAIRLLATSVEKINGESIGHSLDEKVNYLKGLNDWVYEHLITAFNLFSFATNEALTDSRIKKS